MEEILHQLLIYIYIYIPSFTGFSTSQVVFSPDFWTKQPNHPPATGCLPPKLSRCNCWKFSTSNSLYPRLPVVGNGWLVGWLAYWLGWYRWLSWKGWVVAIGCNWGGIVEGIGWDWRWDFFQRKTMFLLFFFGDICLATRNGICWCN